jgi:hypothetical protein
VTNWDDEIESSAGGFYGWGERVGQKMTGGILDYNPTGGSDFNGNPCPLLIAELTEESYSHNTSSGWTKLTAGETVKITCGLGSLNEAVRLAKLSGGDLVQIELAELKPTNKGNPAKIFKVRVARGAFMKASAPAQPAAVSGGFGNSLGNDPWASTPPPDDEPPF